MLGLDRCLNSQCGWVAGCSIPPHFSPSLFLFFPYSKFTSKNHKISTQIHFAQDNKNKGSIPSSKKCKYKSSLGLVPVNLMILLLLILC